MLGPLKIWKTNLSLPLAAIVIQKGRWGDYYLLSKKEDEEAKLVYSQKKVSVNLYFIQIQYWKYQEQQLKKISNKFFFLNDDAHQFERLRD